jgi:hypothetical protein
MTRLDRFPRWLSVPLVIAGLCIAATAQIERAITVREAQLYVSPDTQAAKLGKIERGREVAVMDKSRNYIKVLADLGEGRNVTGWMLDKGVVRPGTPNGDRILFGEAVDSENEASKRGGRRGADKDARRLYYRMAEYFPKSELAGEALWRAADIDWQLNKADVQSRRSAKEREAYLRGKIPEETMNEVRKKFPGTKWSDMADYAKIDNKTCGEWEGLPKCPEKETDMYLDYVKDHPQSPKAAEALFEAAWRQSALIEIYRANNDTGRSDQARAKANEIAGRILSQYAQQGDWAARAQTLIYKVDQAIPTYGPATD